MNEPSQLPVVAQAMPASSVLPPEEIHAKRDSAQARVDAVADLLEGAYAKASTLKLSAEESRQLTQEFPDDAVYKGAKGEETLLYISHAYIRDRLFEVFGPGKWTPVQRKLWGEDFKTARGEAATRIYADVVLIVRGCYVGEAIGAMVYYPNNPKSDYSEASEGAQSEALRRICQKCLGIGLQVYKKDWCQGWFDRQRKGQPRKTAVQQASADPSLAPAVAAAPVHSASAWQPKTVREIKGKKTTTGRDYISISFDGDANIYSSFHAMQGVSAGDNIWIVSESKTKNDKTFWNVLDWQPDKGGGLPEHRAELIARIRAEGQPLMTEFMRMAHEKAWLIPDIEMPEDLPAQFTPRSIEAIDQLVNELKTRLGA